MDIQNQSVSADLADDRRYSVGPDSLDVDRRSQELNVERLS